MFLLVNCNPSKTFRCLTPLRLVLIKHNRFIILQLILLLYNIFVNDFEYAVECTPKLYADDTCSLIEAKTAQDLQNSINNEMIKVTNWMISIQITINPQKSSLLIIIQLILNDPPIKFQIDIDGHYLNLQDSVKYLGIYIHHCVNFNFHTEKTNS